MLVGYTFSGEVIICIFREIKNEVKDGLYDGIRTRNDLQNSPPERLGKPESPNYPEYERLRKEQR